MTNFYSSTSFAKGVVKPGLVRSFILNIRNYRPGKEEIQWQYFFYAASFEVIQSDKGPTYAAYVGNEQSLKFLKVLQRQYGNGKEFTKRLIG